MATESNQWVRAGTWFHAAAAAAAAAVVLADLDYADDISLLFDNLEQAQELLNRIELECTKVGLRPNIKETEVITDNFPPEHLSLTTAGGTMLKEVHGSTQLSKI